LHLCGRTKKAKKDVGIPFLVSFLGLIAGWVDRKRWAVLVRIWLNPSRKESTREKRERESERRNQLVCARRGEEGNSEDHDHSPSLQKFLSRKTKIQAGEDDLGATKSR
jgi:hypothetical protein